MRPTETPCFARVFWNLTPSNESRRKSKSKQLPEIFSSNPRVGNFANVRRATVWSTRMKKYPRQPIIKIGIMFPMDERYRTFRDYLSIAEYAINSVDQALNS